MNLDNLKEDLTKQFKEVILNSFSERLKILEENGIKSFGFEYDDYVYDDSSYGFSIEYVFYTDGFLYPDKLGRHDFWECSFAGSTNMKEITLRSLLKDVFELPKELLVFCFGNTSKVEIFTNRDIVVSNYEGRI